MSVHRPVVAAFLLLAAAAIWQARQPAYAPPHASALPQEHRQADHTSSQKCRSCHLDQYESWHRSFHRTMTTVASAQTILAPMTAKTFQWRGHASSVTPRDGTLWADFVSPFWLRMMAQVQGGLVGGKPERIAGPIVMITGSHHQQVYWIKDPKLGAFSAFPWVWSVVENRWIPNDTSFLAPPDAAVGSASEWSESCLGCHAVAGQPRIDSQLQEADPHVAELGIACEACHSGGAKHIAEQQNPVKRYTNRFRDDDDTTIVQPEKLDAHRATEVCGRCHSVWREKDWAEYEKRGHTFRPGQKLEEHTNVVQLPMTKDDLKPWLGRWLKRHDPSSFFWKDGTIRVAGREYNGLLESACYQKGEMSCGSCHSMHKYKAREDQLRADKDEDQPCKDCHKSIANDSPAHSHHPAGSSGDRCVNCHMPHTTYGLFKAIRSHRVTIPAPAREHGIGKPNACNQCHLDQSPLWAELNVAKWSGRKPHQLTGTGVDLPQSVLHLLVGDASQRALAAWTMGWDDAIAASPGGWQPALLAYILADPYAAVRLVAGRSIRKFVGFSQLEHDFVQPPPEQKKSVEQALSKWRMQANSKPETAPMKQIFHPNGKSRDDVIEAFIRRRNDAPVTIQE